MQNLMDVYENNETLKGVISSIMKQNKRLNYKRNMLECLFKIHKIEVDFRMEYIKELHYKLNPQDSKPK